MITTTALIIENSDMTPDGNLRKEAFEALCEAEVAIHGIRVIKNSHTGLITRTEAPRRVRRASRETTLPLERVSDPLLPDGTENPTS